MRKILATALMLLTLLTASVQNAAGSVFKGSDVLITLRADTTRKLSEQLIAEEEDRRRQLSDMVDVSVPLANQSIDLAAKTILKGGQTTSGTPQPQAAPTHHNHHVRNLVIFGVVLAVGSVCLAAAAK